MSLRSFLTQLTILTAIAALSIAGLHLISDTSSFYMYSWLSLGTFVVLSIVMYHLGAQAAQSMDKYAFINVAILMMIFKMFLCVAIAVTYKLKTQDASMVFVAIFLGIYVVYTIFETYFMMRLSNPKV